MESKNLQYAFYVEYYQDLSKLLEEKKRYQEKHKSKTFNKKREKDPEVSYYNKKNSEVLSIAKNSKERMQKLTDYDRYRNSGNKLSTWEFQSTYPGIVIGTGHIHGVKGKGEIGMGFTFDYVTGLPYLPGSSLKGILRYGFKQTGYIQEVIKDTLNMSLSKEEVEKLEEIIFDGKEQKDRAVFYDVTISNTTNRNLLALDVITPHSKDGLKEPNPITFLRICPGVKLHFEIQLYDVILAEGKKIPKGNIEEIFKSILEDFGIGAKTNVGYGVLEEVK